MNRTEKRKFKYLFMLFVCMLTTAAFFAGCGAEGSKTSNNSKKDRASENDDKKLFSGNKVAEYLGVGYSPDTPFTFFWDGERIITDKDGNLMVKEDLGYVRKDIFPTASDFHGQCRIGRIDDVSVLINREGEIVYRNPVKDYYMYSHELRNGRVLYECNTGQNCWLIDEDGNEVTKPTDNVLSIGADYYRVRTEDGRKILYDCNDKVIFEGDSKVDFGIKTWSETGDQYLWVKDSTNYAYSVGGKGDITIYQLPEMNVVFTAQGVFDRNELGSGVVFAFISDILSDEARLVVIYKGQVTIDTVLEYDQNIIAKGKYEQNKVIVDHDSWNWVYTTYELSTGRFISENTQRSSAGERDDKLFDRSPTEAEKNLACAERLGVDFAAYKHDYNFRYQTMLRAELFNYLEKETARRIFCNFLDNGIVQLFDDVSGEAILSGEIMHAPIPEFEENFHTVFAYATIGEDVGQLVNLATGKTLNVRGEFVGFQKVYAIFKESDENYRIYNFDMDSFVIDSEGKPHKDDSYKQLKKNEPEYVDFSMEGNTWSEGNLSKWPGIYRLNDRVYIEVFDTYTTGTIYFGMTTLDASGEGTVYNEYTVDFTDPDMLEFTIPYQAGVKEVFKLKDDGIFVSLDNFMIDDNTGFYIKEKSY